MEKEYRLEQIQLHPIPPVQFINDACRMMCWRIEMTEPLESTNLSSITSQFAYDLVSFSLELTNGSVVTMSVFWNPNNCSPEVVWKATFRAILLLEHASVPIATIENKLRDEWRFTFVTLENSGALDRDKTPLMLAAQQGNIETIKTILTSSEDPKINLTSLTGNTALIYAAFGGHNEIVDILLKAGADVKIIGTECTLMQAAITGGIDTVDLLLKAGADINSKNRYGETALMYSVIRGNIPIVKKLLINGANPNLIDNRGKTALDWVLSCYDREVAAKINTFLRDSCAKNS